MYKYLISKICIVILLAVIITSSGCSAKGQYFSERNLLKSNESVIIVYRPKRAFQSVGYPSIYLDGVEQSKLKNGGYLVFDVSSGDHLIKAKGDVMMWDVRVGTLTSKVHSQTGKTNYIRLFPHYRGIASISGPANVTWSFNEISEDVALKEVQSLRMSR